jgi:hypothetical protein
MTMNIGRLEFWLGTASAGGFVSFFRGFRIYRQYLLVHGTPEIPIRSITMGRVRVHGKASSDGLLTSPISHTPCCLYQVRIEKSRDADRDEDGEGRQSWGWQHYGSEMDSAPFYLEDSTGRVLVDPWGAECDIESTAVREASSELPSSVAVNGASEVDLLNYVARVGPSAEPPGFRQNLEAEKMMLAMSGHRSQGATRDETMRKLAPHVIEAQARMVQTLEAQGPQSDPLSEELRLAQIELNQHPVWSPEYAKLARRVTKLQAQHRKQAGIESPAPVPLPPPVLSGPPLPPPAPTAEGIVASMDGVVSAAGRYRITERCILPGHEYDVTGTCTENRVAKDANDRNLIRKPKNESIFLISALGRNQVDAMLQKRSQFMIFGGGMLAVFCLAMLLLRLGQF